MSTHKVEIDARTEPPPVVEPAVVEPVAPCDVADVTTATTEPACSPLWMRLLAAGIYLAVASACVVGAVSFFVGEPSTSTDWVFGAFAFGLAFIAAVGVKQSLFPSDWRPE